MRLLALLFMVSPVLAGTPSRSNVVVMLCDDLGYGDLSCYGHPVIRTPNLDRLAGEGLRLTACYAAAPVCSPSRAGMLTGRTPYRSGIYDWIALGSPMHVQRSEVTVATLLKRAGYDTSFVGKWHCNGKFNEPDQPQPSDHGFDHWMATQNNAAPSHADPINFVRNGEPVGPLKGYSSELIVDEAIDWLETRKGGQPFCQFIWFHAPHEPIATAEEFVEQYADVRPRLRAEHYGNVTQIDHAVGRYVAALEKLGVADDTFILFTSDNGPETLNRYPGADRSYGSPGAFRGMKLHLYEGGIRVPGIIRWPGRIKAGQVSDEPVSGVDVLPTLCEIATADVPDDRAMDGASILPLFAGSSIKRSKPLYWQYDRAFSLPKVAIRDGDWKLLADDGLGRFELYNLKDDPAETQNRAADEPERLKRMAMVMNDIYNEVDVESPDWPGIVKRPSHKPRPVKKD